MTVPQEVKLARHAGDLDDSGHDTYGGVSGTGAMGPPGLPGQDGADGPPGPAGASGAAGATGATGGAAQLASITAASAAIAATETVVVSTSLAVGYLTAGMSFRIRAAGVGTTGVTPGSDIFRIRIGPTTLTGTIPTTVTALGIAAVTAQPFDFEAIITLRTSGAGGTVIGECVVQADNVATGRYAVLNSLSTTVATVAVDTTVTNLLELTYISGNANSSNIFHVATIEVLSSGPAGTAIPVPTLLQSLKAAADTPDDDFPGTSLDAKWTVVDGSAGAVSLFGGSGGIYEVGERTGWLAMQIGTSSGDSVVLRQDYTLPDGKCIVTYIALATDEVTTAGASNEVRASLCVNDNDTGPEAGAAGQTLLIMWDSDGSGVMSIDGFDGTTVLGTITASAMYVGGCFFRIDRSGLVYRAMISFDGWSWTLLATKTMATAANNIYLTGECRATMANRVIIAVPWVRQGTALAMDPWPL